MPSPSCFMLALVWLEGELDKFLLSLSITVCQSASPFAPNMEYWDKNNEDGQIPEPSDFTLGVSLATLSVVVASVQLGEEGR